MKENKIVSQILDIIQKTPEEKWESPYLFQKYRNLKSKIPYRGINALWLGLYTMVNNPNWSPFFLTFKQAKEMNCYVKQGSHGVSVEFFKPLRKKKEEAEQPKGDNLDMFNIEEDEEDERPIWMHRTYYVFNTNDISGLKENLGAREVIQEDEKQLYADLVDKIAETGVNIETPEKAQKNLAFYRPSTDTINIPPLEWMGDDTALSVLIHEAIHSTKERLNRGKLPYAEEEVVAEVGSMIACIEQGIKYKPNNSAAYIRSWGVDIEPQRFEKLIRMAVKAVRFLGLEKHYENLQEA